jgi:hypothetical protein
MPILYFVKLGRLPYLGLGFDKLERPHLRRGWPGVGTIFQATHRQIRSIAACSRATSAG